MAGVGGVDPEVAELRKRFNSLRASIGSSPETSEHLHSLKTALEGSALEKLTLGARNLDAELGPMHVRTCQLCTPSTAAADDDVAHASRMLGDGDALSVSRTSVDDIDLTALRARVEQLRGDILPANSPARRPVARDSSALRASKATTRSTADRTRPATARGRIQQYKALPPPPPEQSHLQPRRAQVADSQRKVSGRRVRSHSPSTLPTSLADLESLVEEANRGHARALEHLRQRQAKRGPARGERASRMPRTSAHGEPPASAPQLLELGRSPARLSASGRSGQGHADITSGPEAALASAQAQLDVLRAMRAQSEEIHRRVSAGGLRLST